MGRSCFEQRVRISRASNEPVNSIVQVRRCASGISRITNGADAMALINPLAGPHISELFKMSIVMQIPARPHDPDAVTAKVIIPHSRAAPIGGAEDSRSFGGENIHTFVAPPTTPGSAPRVRKPLSLHALDGNGKYLRSRSERQRKDVWKNAKAGNGHDENCGSENTADAKKHYFPGCFSHSLPLPTL